MDYRKITDELGIRLPLADRNLLDDAAFSSACAAADVQILSTEESIEAWSPIGLHYDLWPIAGDGYGNHFCAKLDHDGSVLEYVFYEHDDLSCCLPYGASLAEAFAVYAALGEEPAAETTQLFVAAAERAGWREESDWSRLTGDDLERARERLRSRGMGVAVLSLPPSRPSWTRTAIRDPRLLRSIPHSADWEDRLRGGEFWYSMEGLPDDLRVAACGSAAPSEPDYEDNQRRAQEVLSQRDDIGWAWLVQADAAGLAQDWERVERSVVRAAACMRHTFAGFPADDLVGVLGRIERLDDELLRLFLANDAAGACAYWSRQAADAEARGAWREAWNAWYRHALHIRSGTDEIESHLDVMYMVAESGGFTCWTKLLAKRLRQAGVAV